LGERVTIIGRLPGLPVHRPEIDRHEPRSASRIQRGQIGQRAWAAQRRDPGRSRILAFALNQEPAGHSRPAGQAIIR